MLYIVSSSLVNFLLLMLRVLSGDLCNNWGEVDICLLTVCLHWWGKGFSPL